MLLYNMKKNLSTTNNRILETYPLPFKRTCKQEILVQVTRKLHKAKEMKIKLATTFQSFHQPE